MSRKPNPAVFAEDQWNPERARQEIRDFLEQARGCHVELIMKDISTVRRSAAAAVGVGPNRLGRRRKSSHRRARQSWRNSRLSRELLTTNQVAQYDYPVHATATGITAPGLPGEKQCHRRS